MQCKHTALGNLRRVGHRGRRAWRGLASNLRARLIGTITHVATTSPVVALTFDDGPHPEYTPLLLDVLERHGARATFFVIGQQARLHPDILRRAAHAGHAIGNHTMDHPLFLAASSPERRRQIHACAEAVAPYGVPLFRPPKGHQNVASRIDVLRTGHQVVIWNAHAEDWRLHDSGWMAEQLERKIAPGSIVLLHDAIWDPLAPGVEDRSPVIETVDQVLERMRGRFHFVTVPELLRHGPAVRRDWIYPKSP